MSTPPLTGPEALVVRLVEREVAERGLQPGARLPTERELAERSGVGRGVVRRGLDAMEARGLVVRHVGRGTFLSAGSPPVDPAAVSSASPAEVMAVRLLVEPASMPLAVVAARAEDLAEVRRCLAGGRDAMVFEEFERWDAAFHRSLAQATRNSLLISVCDLLEVARHQPLWGRMKRLSFSEERRLEYVRDHERVAEAVAERDGEAAAEAMRVHLVRVRAYLLEGAGGPGAARARQG